MGGLAVVFVPVENLRGTVEPHGLVDVVVGRPLGGPACGTLGAPVFALVFGLGQGGGLLWWIGLHVMRRRGEMNPTGGVIAGDVGVILRSAWLWARISLPSGTP